MGGWGLYAPPCGFLPLTQKIFRQPIPEILDFSHLFIADAPMKKTLQKFRFSLAQITFGTPSTKMFFNLFALIKKIFINPS